MKGSKLKFCCIILLLTARCLLLAQETPRTINFTKDQYQAYNQNWAVSQTPERFLVFGNNAGLLEFDGSTWRTYPLPNKQTIRTVACDRQGNIFTGGFEELGVWQRKNGHLEYQSLVPLLESETLINKEEIWHILIIDSFVYFQSFSNIYCYDYKNVRRIVPPDAIMFMQQVQDKLLLPVIGRGLYELTKNGLDFIRGSELFADKRVMCLLPYGENRFLVGTANHGIFIYNHGNFIRWESEIQASLEAYQLNRGIRLANGQIALGTILNGLYIVNAQGKILYQINQKNGLQNNTVLGLFEDVSHNLWIGLDKGIDLVELSSPLTYFKDKNGAIGTVYAAAIFKGNLYIGSNQGVFVKPWRGLQFHADDTDFQLIKGTQGQVWELKVFDNQLLAIHNDGTFSIEGDQATFLDKTTGGWMTLRYPGKSDWLIQGTYTGLIVLKKDEQGKWQYSHRVPDFSEPLRKIILDDLNNIWGVNPNRGLYLFPLSVDLQQFTIPYSFKKKDGLPSEFKVDIEKINNRIVIKSDNRFFVFNGQRNQLEALSTTRNPLFENGDFRLKNGWRGDWFKIYRNKLTYLAQDRQVDFKLALAPDFESIILLDDNLYFLGLDDGYALATRAAMSRFTNSQRFPTVIIRAVEVSNRRGTRFLPTSNANLTLAPNENNLRFIFAQPVYNQLPEYSYLLEGYDTQWSSWQTDAEKEFTRLPAGRYTFKIKSKLSPAITQFSFAIQSPWYQSWWASILYFLTFGMGIWAIERWNQHRLDNQRKILEEEKERQLEEQRIKTINERLQFDVINKSKELANSTMDLIQKNEILVKIKDELQALRSSPDSKFTGRHYQRLTHLIDTHISSDHDWQVFEMNFNQVHEQFFKKLKADFPELTPGDLKLAAYLKMNLSSKEIAPLLNISIRSVENKRYRLRRKLNLEEEENLTEFMLRY